MKRILLLALATAVILGLLVYAINSLLPQEDLIPDEGTNYCAQVQRNDSLSLSDVLGGMEDQPKDQSGVYVLEDGAGSMVQRAWFSEYAEESINIQYFIFSTDNVGLIACDYLVRAANRGVEVNILIDDIMVNANIQDVLTLNSHENIHIKIYNPGMNLGKSLFGKLKKISTDFRNANQRMHNKTFIVDNRVVITGGRNIADEYFDYDHEYNFRDRDVLLLGEVVPEVTRSFFEFWNDSLSVPVTEVSNVTPKNVSDPKRFVRLHEYACNPANFWSEARQRIVDFPSTFQEIRANNELVWVDEVTFVADIPGKNDGTQGLGGGGKTTSALVDLIQNASQSIDIQSPYLITTEESRQLFREAVERGVTVRILTNSLASTDNLEAFSSYQSDRKVLLETGVQIFEFRPDAEERTKIMTGELQKTLEQPPIFGLHAKTMVVDGETVVIGTFNLDPRSANLNTECITIIPSPRVASSVLIGMEIEFQPENSWQVTQTSNPDGSVRRSKRLNTWTRKILPKSIL